MLNADHIITVSDLTRRTVIEKYGINPERATAAQKDMADCIAQKTNEAYADARNIRR